MPLVKLKLTSRIDNVVQVVDANFAYLHSFEDEKGPGTKIIYGNDHWVIVKESQEDIWNILWCPSQKKVVIKNV